MRKVYEHQSESAFMKLHLKLALAVQLFIPYRVTSFLNMQGINGPRHELGKHYFHYEYHTDRVPITTV